MMIQCIRFFVLNFSTFTLFYDDTFFENIRFLISFFWHTLFLKSQTENERDNCNGKEKIKKEKIKLIQLNHLSLSISAR